MNKRVTRFATGSLEAYVINNVQRRDISMCKPTIDRSTSVKRATPSWLSKSATTIVLAFRRCESASKGSDAVWSVEGGIDTHEDV